MVPLVFFSSTTNFVVKKISKYGSVTDTFVTHGERMRNIRTANDIWITGGCMQARLKRAIRLGISVLLMISVVAGVCTTADASDAKSVIWLSRDQFVVLERQDQTPSGAQAPANDHPVELAMDRLTSLLASIDVRAAAGDKPVPLLTAASIQTLAPYLQQGLYQASPADDVTFAIIGLHEALFGFAKSPKVTTGRVFYKDGALNLIIGLAQQDVNERDDRRLSPFTPGSRAKPSAGEWTLLPRAGQTVVSLVRKDWLRFAADRQLPGSAASPATEPTVAPVVPAPMPMSSPAPVAPTAPAPAAVSVAKQPVDNRGSADRLSVLKDLRDKGLISEEEYRSKRMEILNAL